LRAAYGEEKFSRLAALTAKYDPQILFRTNKNINPNIHAPGFATRIMGRQYPRYSFSGPLVSPRQNVWRQYEAIAAWV